MNTENAVELCKALGCMARFSIVELLLKESLCVGAIAGRLEMSQPSVSQHLRILRTAGVVEDRRCGCNIHYSINGETLRLAGRMFEGFSRTCPPADCLRKEKTCAERKNHASTLKN